MIQVVPSLISDAGGAIKEGVKLPFPTVCFWAVADLGGRLLSTQSGPSIQTAYTTGSNIEESLGSEG